MTRRIRIGAAATLVLAAVAALAVPMGARQAAWSQGGAPTARDYIQDGLVAMWDGIENAGWGVHDATLHNWPALVGGMTLTGWSSSSVTWSDMSPSFNAYMQVAASFDFSGGGTVEQVANLSTLQHGFSTPSPAIGVAMFKDDISNTYYAFTVLDGRTPASGFKNNKDEANFCYNLYHDDISCVTATISGGAVSVRDNSRGTSISVASYGATRVRIGSGTGTHVCTGIYSIRIYSRALTAEEIAHNYAVDKARFGLP